MANASSKHFGAGAQGKGDGGGANTELPRDMVGENDILSNRDKSMHNENRGLDGKQVRNDQRQDHAGNRTPDEDHPAGSLPAFNDPAFSPDPAGSPVQADAPQYKNPPKDTEYAGHPEFSQDAAANKPPKGVGNSEPPDEKSRHSNRIDPVHPSPQQQSGAGPALARHSKDA